MDNFAANFVVNICGIGPEQIDNTAEEVKAEGIAMMIIGGRCSCSPVWFQECTVADEERGWQDHSSEYLMGWWCRGSTVVHQKGTHLQGSI
jgi:hypothetical protein